jgi:hypothetical protein
VARLRLARRAFNITSDGSVTITFIHKVQNPSIDGIEILNQDVTPIEPGPQQWVAHRSFDGTTAGPRVQQNSSIDWSRARGAFIANGSIHHGWDDGKMYRRTLRRRGSVCAVTFVADGPGTGFDWGSVRGITLVGGTLYLARADGSLWSAGWNPGLEHGSPVGGSLHLIDNDPSQMWASRGMYVRN